MVAYGRPSGQADSTRGGSSRNVVFVTMPSGPLLQPSLALSLRQQTLMPKSAALR